MPDAEATAGTVIPSLVKNYGPVGAVGTNAHGDVNIHHHATELEHVDLHSLFQWLLRTFFAPSSNEALKQFISAAGQSTV